MLSTNGSWVVLYQVCCPAQLLAGGRRPVEGKPQAQEYWPSSPLSIAHLVIFWGPVGVCGNYGPVTAEIEEETSFLAATDVYRG
jgi:hypothetical protein